MSFDTMHYSDMSDKSETSHWLRDFVRESNRIENIKDTIGADIQAHERLLGLEKIRVPDLEAFVRTITRDHVLRDKVGLDVQVGSHIPPAGGSDIRTNLQALLFTLNARSPFENHLQYEALHPFTDGNGRSGRALWLWQMMHSDMFSRRVDALKGFLDIFAEQAARAGYDLFKSKRNLYYNVLAQGDK